jgi:hypothetical protein
MRILPGVGRENYDVFTRALRKMDKLAKIVKSGEKAITS